jgi:3-isopropylmalate/(R)-2-methylmalate dehydratase small subunit
MQPFTQLKSIAIPLDRANVDTDAIIPKQFLKSIKRTGFGVHLFDEWRYTDVGYPGQDCSKRSLKTDFVLNQPQYQGATILLARENFGCGSSREHAPWALEQYGIRAVIAPSFADIFYNNCFKNGILPIVLSSDNVQDLFQVSLTNQPTELNINLEEQRVSYLECDEETPYITTVTAMHFNIDGFRKKCLLEGLDDIGLTLQHADAIKSFEEKHITSKPWLNL